MPSREAVEAFISATFRSVWAMELLCLLKQDRDRSLSHDEMVSGLRGSDLVVMQSLQSLSAAGLVIAEGDGSAQFAPASADLDALVEEARQLYARSPDAVRRLIVASSNPGITAFADAFRLRKD